MNKRNNVHLLSRIAECKLRKLKSRIVFINYNCQQYYRFPLQNIRPQKKKKKKNAIFSVYVGQHIEFYLNFSF